MEDKEKKEIKTKNKRLTLFIFVVIFLLANGSKLYSESNVIMADEVATVTLRAFYDSGAIHGYVVFRNKNGEMCAIDFFEPAYFKVYNWRGREEILKKSLGYIKVSEFKIMELKNRDIIYAYDISPIIIELLKDRKYRLCFEWGRLEDCKEMVNFFDE